MVVVEKKFNSLMVDIETLGNAPYSCILSIGAVEFDLNSGEVGESFYRNICLDSCLELGLLVSSKTFYWWMEQPEEAKEALKNPDPVSIQRALSEFSMFTNEKDYEVWANSPSFDLSLIKDAMRKCKIIPQWDFRKERDVRTLVSFLPEVKELYQSRQVYKHHALVDCHTQIAYCCDIYSKIEVKWEKTAQEKTNWFGLGGVKMSR